MKCRLLLVAMVLNVAIPMVVAQQALGPQRAGRDADASTSRNFDLMIERIIRTLELDENQKARFKSIVEEVRPRATDTANRGRRTQELAEQLREAAKAGDDARVAELREQIQTLRRSGGSAVDELYERLDGILTDEQKPKLRELREGRRPAVARRPGGLDRLKAQLDLDEVQAAEFDRLATAYDERRKGGLEGDAETLKLVDQMREAALSGDADAVNKLRDQLRPRVDIEGIAMREFVANLEPFLDDEQVDKLHEHASRARAQRGEVDARTLLRLVQRVEHVTPDQRDEIKKIEREARDQMRSARRDPGAMPEIDRQVQAKVREALSEEQNAELDRLINDEARGVVRRGRNTEEEGRDRLGHPRDRRSRTSAEEEAEKLDAEAEKP